MALILFGLIFMGIIYWVTASGVFLYWLAERSAFWRVAVSLVVTIGPIAAAWYFLIPTTVDQRQISAPEADPVTGMAIEIMKTAPIILAGVLCFAAVGWFVSRLLSTRADVRSMSDDV